jgi:hypothetical protein
MLAAHLEQARPVLAALEANGWADVVLDPGADREALSVPDAVAVIADVPAGQFGFLKARAARIVTGGLADLSDVFQTGGGARIGDLVPVLACLDVAEEAAASLPADCDPPDPGRRRHHPAVVAASKFADHGVARCSESAKLPSRQRPVKHAGVHSKTGYGERREDVENGGQLPLRIARPREPLGDITRLPSLPLDPL